MSCCGPKNVSNGTQKPQTSACCAPQETSNSCCGPANTETAAKEKASSSYESKEVAKTSCCGPTEAETAAPAAEFLASATKVSHQDVSEYYGKTVNTRSDLQTSACLVDAEGDSSVRRLMRNIHPVILEKFYGCGSPIPPLLKGCTVLDLGCGAGRDVYTVAQLVGDAGKVIGVDMTEEQLSVAREYEEWHRQKFGFAASNVELKKAFIEDLKTPGIEDSSLDVVISNCVVNLAPDKLPVLSEVARVLKPGGELYFSDVYADRRVPEHLQKDKVLFGECLSGALYFSDFRRLLSRVGLSSWGITHARQLKVENPAIAAKLGDIRFFSLTVRAVKLGADEMAEDSPEDYGQVATYLGSIPGEASSFSLDLQRVFLTGQPTPVDSTTAAMLQASRYGQAFEISSKGSHRGPFLGWRGQLPSSAGPWLQSSSQLVEKAVVSCC